MKNVFLFKYFLSGILIFSLFQACSPFETTDETQSLFSESDERSSDTSNSEPGSSPVEGDVDEPAPVIENNIEGPSKLVSIIVAYGPARTIISCDSGETWVANQYDPAVDDVGSFAHHENRANQLIYRDGYFYYMEGWAANPATGGERGSRIFRSSDGINWVKLAHVKDTTGFTMINGRMVISDRRPEWSDDLGQTWTAHENRIQSTHVSMTTIIKADGTPRVIAVGDRETVTVSDDGANWETGSLERPGFCGGRPIFGNNVGVLLGKEVVCYSLDEGKTWLESSLTSTQGVTSGVWNGTEFVLYRKALRENNIHTSPDGINWTTHSNLSLPIGRELLGKSTVFYDKESGRYLAHDRESFLISDDGFNFRLANVDESQLRGRFISFFQRGLVRIGSDHPCF